MGSVRENLVDQEFGKLKVTEFNSMRPRGTKGRMTTYWLCKCKCGNFKVISSESLKTGRSNSCGCIRHTHYQDGELKITNGRFVNLTNQAINNWEVIKYSHTLNGNAMWECRCVCGNIRTVAAYALTSNNSKSCGCIGYQLVSESKIGKKNPNWNPDKGEIELNRRLHMMLSNMITSLQRHGVTIKSNNKIGRNGYSRAELKAHLETFFNSKINWDNHGKKRGQWSIDHIKPIKAFLAEGITDPIVINALSNLRPMLHSKNISKGAKYNGIDYASKKGPKPQQKTLY